MQPFKSVSLALSILLASTAIASTEDVNWAMDWAINNNTPSNVQFNFFSPDMQSMWHPNQDRTLSWLVTPHQQTHLQISCTYGKLVCFGAWEETNTNVIWGFETRSCYSCGINPSIEFSN